MKPLMPIFVAALIAGSPCLAAADARLMVQPTGKDAFLLSGEDLEGYTSGEILLLYEANDGGLADVVVSSGLGALAGLRISSVSPGVVNFTMKSVRSMRDGTGPMAQIRLKGRITHLSGWLQNEEGSGTQPATEIVIPKPSQARFRRFLHRRTSKRTRLPYFAVSRAPWTVFAPRPARPTKTPA